MLIYPCAASVPPWPAAGARRPHGAVDPRGGPRPRIPEAGGGGERRCHRPTCRRFPPHRLPAIRLPLRLARGAGAPIGSRRGRRRRPTRRGAPPPGAGMRRLGSRTGPLPPPARKIGFRVRHQPPPGGASAGRRCAAAGLLVARGRGCARRPHLLRFIRPPASRRTSHAGRGRRHPDAAGGRDPGVGFMTQCGMKPPRSEDHTSELQSQSNLVCRLLLEKKKRWSHPSRPLAETSLARQVARALLRKCVTAECVILSCVRCLSEVVSAKHI